MFLKPTTSEMPVNPSRTDQVNDRIDNWLHGKSRKSKDQSRMSGKASGQIQFRNFLLAPFLFCTVSKWDQGPIFNRSSRAQTGPRPNSLPRHDQSPFSCCPAGHHSSLGLAGASKTSYLCGPDSAAHVIL